MSKTGEEQFGIEVFLFEQPQCRNLTGEALEEAYNKWLDDIYKEMEADKWLSMQKDMHEE